MTDTPPPNLDDDLWRAIEGLQLDDPNHDLTFTRRLARENRWQEWYATRVVDEYKRFLYLLGRAGHPVTPSDPVDQAWHLHLTYSQNYWEKLAPHFPSPPHHGPTEGGDAEDGKFRVWYGKTLESYAGIFGEDPPDHIWETVEERFRPDQRWIRVNAAKFLLFPRRKFVLWTGLLIASLVLNIALVGAFLMLFAAVR